MGSLYASERVSNLWSACAHHHRPASDCTLANHLSRIVLRNCLYTFPRRIAITMDDTAELTERFERYCGTKDNDVPSEVLNELQSIQRVFSISAEELDFKWQAYNMKMGGEEKMDLKTARDFKKDLQDSLEKESRGKLQQRSDAKRVAHTPRAAKGGDMYDMYVVF